MTGAWIDPPDSRSPDSTVRSGRAGTVALVIVFAALVLAVAAWARFLTGASDAPVPALYTGAVPMSTVVVPRAIPGPTPQPISGSAAETAVEPAIDAAWLDRTAAAAGIPRRALQAYAGADLELAREEPSCRLGWNTLAAIGSVESGNGRTLTDDGYSTSPILGPTVDGGLRAEGPMQFMPATWTRWGADGNGDGVSDPNQIDDAALAAARYLCSYGDLSAPAGWHGAVFGYNHLESYVAAVAVQATEYAQRAG